MLGDLQAALPPDIPDGTGPLTVCIWEMSNDSFVRQMALLGLAKALTARFAITWPYNQGAAPGSRADPRGDGCPAVLETLWGRRFVDGVCRHPSPPLSRSLHEQSTRVQIS